MFRNYFKVAFRNLWKYKTFSAINIVGLAVGLCSFLLISLYVLDELSYDRHFDNAARIYRINSDIIFGGGELRLPQTSDMMGATLKKDYPEVEEYTRIFTNSGSKMIKKGGSYINEPSVAHVDSTFFTVFSLEAISGDLKNSLNEPNTVVISEAAAKKYFNSLDVIGKTIETNDNASTLYEITAVTKNLPTNSHFNFDLLFSMKNVDYNWGQFISHNFHTYLLLKDGADEGSFEKKFDEYILRYVVPQAKQFMNINSMEDFEKAGNKLEYTMTPLTKIHLYSTRQFEIAPSGNVQYVYIFSMVALFILLIACINFMNLTTARSANRAREVGIRKVLGTERKDLITQFLTESTLMAALSLVMAIFITWLVLPLFNEVTTKQMDISSLYSPVVLPLLIALPFLVGLLAGSYPAFYLSSFKPIVVLKGKLQAGARSVQLRSVLVVFQFLTSIILIIGTIIIYLQLNYIRNKNLGFNKDQVLVIDDAYSLGNNIDAFKNEILAMPGVVSGTMSSFLPVSNSSRNDNTFSKESVTSAESGINMQTWAVDQDYIPTMGMQIVKGRNFSTEFLSDSTATIINETMEKFLDYPNPIGQKIYRSDDGGVVTSYTIVGVVKNFNFESVKRTVGPLSFFLRRSPGLVSFKINADQVPALLKNIESKWKTLAAGMPFSYRFLDESFDEMYRSEQRVGKIALSFAIIAILIACLGLFGLATYIAEQRTKEIGIRKVLGASVGGIVRLLSKEFVKLVLIAFVIATPFAWWAMNQWLKDFAFRVNISWWIFLVAGCLALLIAMATISLQAVKAALANPVKNLRNE
ncbi:MAG: FtsX-like permease family protein [Flavisolibacter sp.]